MAYTGNKEHRTYHIDEFITAACRLEGVEPNKLTSSQTEFSGPVEGSYNADGSPAIWHLCAHCRRRRDLASGRIDSVEETLELFRHRLSREPTADELARIEDGIEAGRDGRRVVAGYMATDYHRRNRGPNAMREIRAQRHTAGSASRLRSRFHALVDEIVDYLEGGAVRL